MPERIHTVKKIILSFYISINNRRGQKKTWLTLQNEHHKEVHQVKAPLKSNENSLPLTFLDKQSNFQQIILKTQVSFQAKIMKQLEISVWVSVCSG